MHGGIIGNPLYIFTFLLHEFHLHLVPLIPYSESLKQSSSDPIFFIFLHMWKINHKTTIKTKTLHYLKKLKKIFSFA